MPSPAIIAAVLLAINLIAFANFGLDKWQARRGFRRTRESTLLWLAFLGGTPGAWAGRSVFRHKTRKQPFGKNLVAITIFQVVAVGGYLGWHLAGQDFAVLHARNGAASERAP